MMQTYNVMSKVNVHNLRPMFHRFLNVHPRILPVHQILGIPPDAAVAFKKTRDLLDASADIELHMHRMVPFETTDPGIRNLIAVLCIARENASGGFVMTKTKKVELIPGELSILPDDVTTWYVSAIGEDNTYEDTFVDVVWCTRAYSSNT